MSEVHLLELSSFCCQYAYFKSIGFSIFDNKHRQIVRWKIRCTFPTRRVQHIENKCGKRQSSHPIAPGYTPRLRVSLFNHSARRSHPLQGLIPTCAVTPLMISPSPAGAARDIPEIG
jgi:hypothetical protein